MLFRSELVEAIEQCRKDFVSAMNDDFNTREAIASLFQLARIVNNHPSSSLTSDLRSELVRTFLYYGNQVLGLFPDHIIDASDRKSAGWRRGVRDSVSEESAGGMRDCSG